MTDTASTSEFTDGLPERLVKHAVRYADHRSVDRALLTPMIRHYVELKDQYPHALLLYRVGDFFETFFQDAIAIARELELILTAKDAGKDIGKVPLAGIPITPSIATVAYWSRRALRSPCAIKWKTRLMLRGNWCGATLLA